MKTTWGKYPVFQRRHIITVSVNDGIVTEAKILNKESDNPTKETPKVVVVHKDPPKVDYKGEQTIRHDYPLHTEGLGNFILGIVVGVILTVIVGLWLY